MVGFFFVVAARESSGFVVAEYCSQSQAGEQVLYFFGSSFPSRLGQFLLLLCF